VETLAAVPVETLAAETIMVVVEILVAVPVVTSRSGLRIG